MQVVRGMEIPFLLRYRMHVYQNSSQIPFRNRDILGLKELTELRRMTDITDRTKLRMIKELSKCVYPCGYKLTSRRKSVVSGGHCIKSEHVGGIPSEHLCLLPEEVCSPLAAWSCR